MVEIFAHGEKSADLGVDFKLTGDVRHLEVRHLKFGELSEEQITLLHDLADSTTVSSDVSKAIYTALYNLWDLQGLLGGSVALEHKAALLEGRRRRTEELCQSV